MGTEMALRRRTMAVIHMDRIIGTSLHAGGTTDTTVAIEIDDAVVMLKKGRGWADLHARRIAAMIAAEDRRRA